VLFGSLEAKLLGQNISSRFPPAYLVIDQAMEFGKSQRSEPAVAAFGTFPPTVGSGASGYQTGGMVRDTGFEPVTPTVSM
jgi:hypothetical protein